MNKPRLRPSERASHQSVGGARGQSLAEYLVVLVLVGISLTAGPASPLEQIFRAIAGHHARLTDAVSRP